MLNEAAELLETLKASGKTLASGESLTAGLFGARICEVPGASAVYLGGVISYHPSVKEKLLNVKESTINKYSVVSSEVAAEMAIGCQRATGADIAISCTGNAGPSVEPGGKPVGCVFLGLAYGGNVWTVPLQLSGDRNEIREKTVLAMIRFIASLFPKTEVRG